MLNFSFKKKSTDNNSQEVKNDAPIQNSEVEEDIFALAAKEEEEKNIDNLVTPDALKSNSTPEIPAIADVKGVENKLPEQLLQRPLPINDVAKQVINTEAVGVTNPEQQPILEDKKIVEIESATIEINNNPQENELPAIKPVESNNLENISQEVVKNNQENEASIKAVELTPDNKKFTHPNEQDPAIWVPQLIEILSEMSKEEVLAE
jgi:hypothetical protein